jgi:hypothetical protein
MLLPLKQWICDTCGEIIVAPEQGWFEFLRDQDNHNAYGFKIVHHKVHSPKYGHDGCYQYTNIHHDINTRDRCFLCDMHLDQIIGGLIETRYIISLLDPYPVFLDRRENFVIDSRTIREWVEIYNRLFTPFYEEARLYFDLARKEGIFKEETPCSYLEEVFLKEIIERYSVYS